MSDAEKGVTPRGDVPLDAVIPSQRASQSPEQVPLQQYFPQSSYDGMTTSPLPSPPPSYNNMLTSQLPPPKPSYNNVVASQLPPQHPSYNNMITSQQPPPQPNYNNMVASQLPPQHPSYNNMLTSQLPPQHPSYNNMITSQLPPPQPNYTINSPLPQPQQPSYGTNNAGPVLRSDQNQVAIYTEKSVMEAYVLALSPFGLLGAHHFYLQRNGWGILYFLTGGLMGIGYLIDWFRVPCLVKQANEKIRNQGRDEKTISDAYTLWFPMGILGFHHYYLENYAWGVLYTCTLGLCGIGWIVDAFRMPSIVRYANERRLATDIQTKDTCLTVALLASPFGPLGAHHYYLNRPIWGILYTFTLGLGGIGWIVDWFRISVLLKRTNKAIVERRDDNMKTIDDTYVLWFSFGLLGLHHFYLDRPLWGVLYFFTLGIIGIGWLIDMCRIPSLVEEANLKIQAEQDQLAFISGPTRQTGAVPNISVAQSIHGYFNNSIPYPVVYMPTNTYWQNAQQGAYGGNYQQ